MGFEFGQIILQQKTKAPEETLRGLFSYIKKIPATGNWELSILMSRDMR